LIIEKIDGLYQVTAMKPFRKTKGVVFDLVPNEIVEETVSVDRVIHENGAISPGEIGDVKRPWYFHPFQRDNLLVLHGYRTVELYTKDHGKIVTFEIHPDRIYKNGELLYEGGVMLSWPTKVFHRITSGEKGSASLNFAMREKGFDIKTNFNIYDLDLATGEFYVLREGYKDQV